MGSYAVIITYSFDDDVAVYLFDNETDAKEYLKSMITAEYRIDTEENGWESTITISDDGYCGEIVNQFPMHTDVTTARIGRVYS